MTCLLSFLFLLRQRIPSQLIKELNIQNSLPPISLLTHTVTSFPLPSLSSTCLSAPRVWRLQKRYPMCLSCSLVVCGFWYCIEWYAHEHQIFPCASLNLFLCLFPSQYNGDNHCASIFQLPLHLRLFSISMHRIVKFTNSAANSQSICPDISYIAQFQAEITSLLIMTYSSSILSSPKTSISSPNLSGISPLTLQNYKQIINKLVIFYSR